MTTPQKMCPRAPRAGSYLGMKLALGTMLALTVACTGVHSDPSTTHSPIKNHDDVKWVFGTSKRYQGGGLGGLEGADAICASHAAVASNAGTYKAWLSAYANPARDRLTHSALPYALVDGTRVADSWDDLVHADLEHAIDLDEYAMPLVEPQVEVGPASPAWTFTGFDGNAARWEPGGTETTNPRRDCDAWTSYGLLGDVGSWTETGPRWTGSGNLPCTAKAVLYCLEQ